MSIDARSVPLALSVCLCLLLSPSASLSLSVRSPARLQFIGQACRLSRPPHAVELRAIAGRRSPAIHSATQSFNYDNSLSHSNRVREGFQRDRPPPPARPTNQPTDRPVQFIKRLQTYCGDFVANTCGCILVTISTEPELDTAAGELRLNNHSEYSLRHRPFII